MIIPPDSNQRAPQWTAAACVCLGVVLTFLAGCNRPWRDAYFDKGKHKLTQADVQEELGPPHTRKSTLLGEETVWTYRYAMSEEETDPWGRFGKTAERARDSARALVGKSKDVTIHPTLYCMKYTLKFDEEKLLKEWKRDRCGLPEQASNP